MARGSVVKRGDKFAIKFRDPSGKQRWKTIGASRKEAEKALIQAMGEVHLGTYTELKEIGFTDFAKKWLKDHCSSRVKPSTYQGYRDILKLHLAPYFRSTKLSLITPHHVEEYLSHKKRQGKLSARTIGYHLVTLKMLFKRACIWEYIHKNPAEHIERPRPRNKEMDFLTVEELNLFLGKLDKRHYPLFLTAALTGVRRSELFALRWSDINWATNQIHVRRSYVLGKLEEPKSRHSVRAIVMCPTLRQVLRRHQLSCAKSELNLVFPNKKGGYLSGQNLLRRHFYPALRRAGLRSIRFHDLRHTYASILIAQGENIKFIQSQLGHGSIQVTLDRYGHLMPEIQHGVSERLEETVFGSKMVAKPVSEPSTSRPS